ncbi:MAG TPA: sugar isomerase domain-containing protein [Aggregatilineales bacterium]|nr:sugar isomerase domain-containing protein [Aggregatilineales bacterium]
MNLEYLARATEILEQIDRTQAGPIARAAETMANSIASDGLVHMFGAGHSALPVAEAYPKCGNIVGFHPLVELALMNFTSVIGSNGLPQFTFLERAEGYGRAILESHVLHACDTMLIFSQSGINPPVLEVALGAQEHGLKVVAVTSVGQCSQSVTRHSSGKRLIEAADIVIDTCVPFGDVTLQVEGMDEPMGPASTLASIAIVNALIVEVAKALVSRGEHPIVNPTLNAPGGVAAADARMRRALAEYRRRTQRPVSDTEDEHADR